MKGIKKDLWKKEISDIVNAIMICKESYALCLDV
jgi:hypothetical protein